MQLVVSPTAIKELASLNRRDRDALIGKAEAFAAEPFAAHSWASPLRGMIDRVPLRARASDQGVAGASGAHPGGPRRRRRRVAELSDGDRNAAKAGQLRGDRQDSRRLTHIA